MHYQINSCFKSIANSIETLTGREINAFEVASKALKKGAAIAVIMRFNDNRTQDLIAVYEPK